MYVWVHMERQREKETENMGSQSLHFNDYNIGDLAVRVTFGLVIGIVWNENICYIGNGLN